MYIYWWEIKKIIHKEDIKNLLKSFVKPHSIRISLLIILPTVVQRPQIRHSCYSISVSINSWLNNLLSCLNTHTFCDNEYYVFLYFGNPCMKKVYRYLQKSLPICLFFPDTCSAYLLIVYRLGYIQYIIMAVWLIKQSKLIL